MEDDEEKRESIKLILLGESGVGKTSLINVSVGKGFSNVLNSSFSCSYVQKKFQKGDKIYVLNIWDTAGQETFRSMTKLFIKNSKIVIFVYAINNKLSFNGLSYWVDTIKNNLGNEIVLCLLGNKSDLYMEQEVNENEAIEFAENIGAKFVTVSARTNPKGFITIIENLLDQYLQSKGDNTKEKSFEIKQEKHKKNKKKCCQ